ncbi:MAG: hypothetical protein ABI878_06655 [Acidobacteriota bacterium]
MVNPEYIFKGMSHHAQQCIDLEQINLDRSESFLVDENDREILLTDEPAVRELNWFGIDPNDF